MVGLNLLKGVHEFMRKFLIIFLTVLLSFAASAEGIDYAILSNDELMSMMLEISNEIDARGIDATPISSGGYLVGTDIRAGQWEITNATDISVDVFVDVFDETGELTKSGGIAYPNNSIFVSLKDGMTLRINSFMGLTCYIKEVENSFAP